MARVMTTSSGFFCVLCSKSTIVQSYGAVSGGEGWCLHSRDSSLGGGELREQRSESLSGHDGCT